MNKIIVNWTIGQKLDANHAAGLKRFDLNNLINFKHLLRRPSRNKCPCPSAKLVKLIEGKSERVGHMRRACFREQDPNYANPHLTFKIHRRRNMLDAAPLHQDGKDNPT